MNKISLNKISLKILLLTSLILVNITSTVWAEDNTSTPAESPKQSTSILEAILSLFKSPERRFISRGDRVCLISPGDLREQLIWSDRPLFIWQGEIPESKINLTKSAENPGEKEQLVWTQIVSENTQTIAYTGEALQPGTYYWELISDGKTDGRVITLMTESRREAIAAELTALENKLENDGATEEDIAIAKADYFVRQKLGSDALQQLYSVSNPSPRLTAQIIEIEQHLCQIDE